ncbi:MAG: preprotein translocase subunit SecA [Nitriliruptoraceae bacterium]
MSVLDKILRAGEGRQAKTLQVVVDAVKARADEFAALSDDELRGQTAMFKARLEAGETLEQLQFDVFAAVREAAWRVLGERPYDVQVFGGAALHAGNIAEMKTGEGKTLTSTMPVFLNALTGRGVHIVTVNEYLAKRDADWMGRVHRFMGLEVGVVHSGQTKDDKRAAYRADITYGTNNEFGFDYLRDNMAWDKASQVQRGHYMALVDEVDSILVDEARTPLIISGPTAQLGDLYAIFARRVVPNMERGVEGDGPGEGTGDYLVDEAKRTVAVTELGVAKVEKLLGVDNLYEQVNTPLIHHLQNALRARDLYRKDREYIVVDGEVKIVDENTGRVLEGRRYSEGLHQAIEAKEGVKVKEENQTLATITLQNYYRTYEKLAGMTGTAKTEEVEFLEIYSLGVVEVPTNRPVVRDDAADLIYKSEDAKFEAVAEEISERHAAGQPMLIGTTSVEKSERLARQLTRMGIAHEVLNAKNHAREAEIVSQAGRLGAVTVSTNMAGRGTDIVLGGNPEEMARADARKLGDVSEERREKAFAAALEKYATICAEEGAKVKELGGLYVLGTERHESRRIDNQLRGRSGRQGDPGGSRFFLSLQDDLMRLFNAAAVDRIMTRLRIPDDMPIEHKWVTKAVANAQRQVESLNFDRRKNVLKYDDVLNEQRKVVYGQRQRLIEGDPDAVEALAADYRNDTVEALVDEHCPQGVFPEEWDLDGLATRVEQIWDHTFDFSSIDLEAIESADLVDALQADGATAYEQRISSIGGPDVMREVERRVILSIVDRKWREHLYEMDALRDGIGLRAVGQRDPLTEYQREAYDSFVAMMGGVKEEAVTYFFRVPITVAEPPPITDGESPPVDAPAVAGADGPVDAQEQVAAAIPLGAPADQRLTYQAAAPGGASSAPAATDGQGRQVERRQDGTTVRRVSAGATYTAEGKVGRNDPCHCGSGQKFKRCHGA